MEKYKPELGQMAFGCPSSEFECPNFIKAGLSMLADEIERVEWNITQQCYDAPTNNNAESYITNIFEMHAYYWGNDENLMERPNFKYNDFEVRWYKYMGRGMSMNRAINAIEFFEIIDKCLKSVQDKEDKYHMEKYGEII